MLVMVLNDGETFTDLAGCKIIDVDDNVEGDDIDVAVKEVFDGEVDDGRIVVRFTGEDPFVFTRDEALLVAEAILYMEEHGRGEPPIYKDDLGRTVPKRRREVAWYGLADKLHGEAGL